MCHVWCWWRNPEARSRKIRWSVGFESLRNNQYRTSLSLLNMACPHFRWKQGCNDDQVHISVPLCFRRARSMECVECDLLLRVVKEYKPGWISGDDTTDSKLFIGLEHGYGFDSPKIIRLLEGTPKPSWSYENEPNKVYKYQYDGLEVVGSFCYFRRKKGIFLSSRKNLKYKLT
jgi:hypothetical protein